MGKASEIQVLDGKVRLLQPEKGFKTSLDSVMLASACLIEDEQSLLDMGCGVGGASFCVLQRKAKIFLTGVDIQQDYIDMAKQNASLNEHENAEFICSDIRDFEAKERFDHVICNPPYLEKGEHLKSPTKSLALARGHDDELSLKGWIRAGLKNLKSGGSFTIIHRADAADRIIRAMGKSFGAIEIIPLWPQKAKSAKRVIIRAIKDRKSPAHLHPGLVLHEEDGSYSKQADLILRAGKALI